LSVEARSAAFNVALVFATSSPREPARQILELGVFDRPAVTSETSSRISSRLRPRASGGSPVEMLRQLEIDVRPPQPSRVLLLRRESLAADMFGA
jgi:hypothetical protein